MDCKTEGQYFLILTRWLGTLVFTGVCFGCIRQGVLYAGATNSPEGANPEIVGTAFCGGKSELSFSQV